MILVFIDETGTINKNDQMEWFGLGATIIESEKVQSVADQFKPFISSIEQKYNFKFEIHARALNNSRSHPYNSMTTGERMSLFEDSLKLCASSDLKFCSSFISKKQFHDWKNEGDYLERVVEKLIEQIVSYMDNVYPNQEVILFYDQIQSHKIDLVKKAFSDKLKNGTPHVYPNYFFKDIFYLLSEKYVPIQISDIILYVVRRYISNFYNPQQTVYGNHANNFFNIIKSILYTGINGKIYGNGVKIIGNPSITF